MPLGAKLCIARQPRKESLQVFASRIGVSIPTIRKTESGDTWVGAYASAQPELARIRLLLRMVGPVPAGLAL